MRACAKGSMVIRRKRRRTIMTHLPRTADTGTYLVVLREIIVGQDIAMTIQDHNPDARVIIAATLAEAVAAVEGVDAVAVAFVHAPSAEVARSPLAEAVAARGGRIVLMGHEIGRDPKATVLPVLAFPFVSSDILALLDA
jgi:hypothetical protein